MPNIARSTVQKLASIEPFPQPPLIRHRHPVVLMHGFGLLAVIRRNGHLHDVAMHLRQHGVRAFAPNVAPYDCISARAAMWAERIDRVLEECEADEVNLIAHSMGGLDARYLISRMGYHDRVASLTTISTPHRGTPIAEIVLQQPERLREWAAEVVDWLGANALVDGSSNVRQAVLELTPTFVQETFNPATPDHPTVQYWSYTGCAGRGATASINPLLAPLNLLVYSREGPNDGYISCTSSAWGTCLGSLDADHMRQIGLPTSRNGSFDTFAFYCNLVRMLADEGL